jgi:hypothetical protein
VTAAISKAETYLHSRQNSDGSFSNSGFSPEFSSIWTMPAIKSLGQDDASWTINNNTPSAYLGSTQNQNGSVNIRNTDGSLSVSTSTLVQATSYAIPAAAHLSWSEILHNFAKPAVYAPTPAGGPGLTIINLQTTTTTPATTTALMTTSTIEQILSTSTEAVAVNTTNTTTSALQTPSTNLTRAPNITIHKTEPVVVKKSIKPAVQQVAGVKEVKNEESVNKQIAAALPIVAPPEKTVPNTISPLRKIFLSSLTIAGSLGAYLAWRFLQSLL